MTIASKPTSEQYILGEILSQLIENQTDIRVVRKFGIGGGTSNIHPALLAGEIDLYPECTGTAWLFVLKQKQITNPDSLYAALQKSYHDKINLNWACLLGRWTPNHQGNIFKPTGRFGCMGAHQCYSFCHQRITTRPYHDKLVSCRFSRRNRLSILF